MPLSKPNLRTPEFADLRDGKFACLFRRKLGRRPILLPPHRRRLWLALSVQWLSLCGIKFLRPLAAIMLEAIPLPPLTRPIAVKMTPHAAGRHEAFQELARRADTLRDQKKFAEAEPLYKQALAFFPLYADYHVQFAHVLKEQNKYIEAFVHYCIAMGAGAPAHDVTEHLLFAADRAGIRAHSVDVERLATAWTSVERTLDDWDAPPVKSDFVDFARLFWGNVGLVTTTMLQSYLLKCVTRKELFIAFLRMPETLHHNSRLFILMKERPLVDV